MTQNERDQAHERHKQSLNKREHDKIVMKMATWQGADKADKMKSRHLSTLKMIN